MNKRKFTIDEINKIYFMVSDSIFNADRTVNYFLDDFRSALGAFLTRDIAFRALCFLESRSKRETIIDILKVYQTGLFIELRKILVKEKSKPTDKLPAAGSRTGGHLIYDISRLTEKDFEVFFRKHNNYYNNLNYKEEFKILGLKLKKFCQTNYKKKLIDPNNQIIVHKDSEPHKREKIIQGEKVEENNVIIYQKCSYIGKEELDQPVIKDCLNQLADVVQQYLRLVSWTGVEDFPYFAGCSIESFISNRFDLFGVENDEVIDQTIDIIKKELQPALSLVKNSIV